MCYAPRHGTHLTADAAAASFALRLPRSRCAPRPGEHRTPFAPNGPGRYTDGRMETRDDIPDWLAWADAALLAECDVHIYKASGPGGQHRNKVSSAVRLRHRPTGITTHGDDSRSQHENKRLALKRLRMEIALQIRRPADPEAWEAALPEPVAACLPRCRPDRPNQPARLDVGRKDGRFWPLAQFLLDMLDACEGQLRKAAESMGITTSNLVAHFKKDRHLFAAASRIRTDHDQKPLK